MNISVSFEYDKDYVRLMIPDWKIDRRISLVVFDGGDSDTLVDIKDTYWRPEGFVFPGGELLGCKALNIRPYGSSDTTFASLPMEGVHRIITRVLEEREERLIWSDNENHGMTAQSPKWGPPFMELDHGQHRGSETTVVNAFIKDPTQYTKVDPSGDDEPYPTRYVMPRGDRISKRWYDSNGLWKSSEYQYLVNEILNAPNY